MRTIICTVGTSLKNNSKNALGFDAENIQELSVYLKRSAEVVASAETNSLFKLISKEAIKAGDRIIFLYSDTVEGYLCANALKDYYKQKGFVTESIRIDGLKYNEKSFANLGLRRLVDQLISYINKYKEDNTIDNNLMIIATGGFKAEIAFATLVGLVFGVPVLYVHDKFDDIITMPPLPITLDLELIAEYEEIFKKIDEGISVHEWEEFIKKWSKREGSYPPKEILNLIVNDDDIVYLTPAGEVYYKVYCETLYKVANKKFYIATKASNYLKSLDKINKQKYEVAIRKILGKIGIPEKLGQTTDLFVYPRGHCPERLFYFEESDKLYICEIASHIDQTYERLLERGVWKKDYTEFEECSLTWEMFYR